MVFLVKHVSEFSGKALHPHLSGYTVEMVREGSDHRAFISVDTECNKTLACGPGLDDRSPEAEQPGGLLGIVSGSTICFFPGPLSVIC